MSKAAFDNRPGSHPRFVNTKPVWRGWIHAGAAPLALAAGVVLIAASDTASAKWAAGVMAGSSLLLFAFSALYHLFTWSPRVIAVLRRLDHANIFLLIAGTYTPLAVDGLPYPKNIILLTTVWGGAVLGVALRLIWLSAPRWLYVILYLALGWAALAFAGDIAAANPATMILVFAGGVFYSLGAVFYARKRPNPFPGVFGFHELFHACTVIAFACHWTGILFLALDPVR